nr:tetratricopeptide repeat protein [Marinicella sp. W31]MDC2879259.1 hypothetical protein [Marinicella sp. W31]
MADNQAAGTVTSQNDYLPLSGPSLLLLRKADKALSRGETQEAIDALNEAIRQRPDSGELRAALVEALRRAGRDEDAEKAALDAANDPMLYTGDRRRLSEQAAAIGQELAAQNKPPVTQEEAEVAAPAMPNENTGQSAIDGAPANALDAETRGQLSQRADAIRQERADESETEEAAEDMAAKAKAIPAASPDTAPLNTSDPAYQAADAAYRAYARGDYRKAVAEAEKAVRLAPPRATTSSSLKMPKPRLRKRRPDRLLPHLRQRQRIRHMQRSGAMI